MINNLEYVRSSLELHVFFLRIMKEHALFLEAGFTKANADFQQEAECFKNEFENLLCDVVTISGGILSPEVLCSGEIATDFTLNAEKQTECLTGIGIDTSITEMEYQLCNEQMNYQNCDLLMQVSTINQNILSILDQFIQFKETIINNIKTCAMFTMNYPLLLEHILREAKLYRCYLSNYINGNYHSLQTMRQIELFWNQIMMEHALFIRGLLDPSEHELIKVSNDFVKEYQELLDCACTQTDAMINDGKCNPYEETLKIKEFKTAGTKGILNCEIQSIIVPLLADHVLREANHYLRLLKNK